MRVFKHWRRVEATVLIGGVERTISCFGGSNLSGTDALDDGQDRLEAVKRRIARREKGKGAGYEGDIREEPIEWLGDQDVVTRNRYGAEVLNTTSIVFVDIDQPPPSIMGLFRARGSPERRRQSIRRFLDRQFHKPDLGRLDVRVYETHSGVRLIVGLSGMDPRSEAARELMRSFNADRLYAALCARQNCYRARLTPKPHRIGMKGMRRRYPYEDSDRDFINAWIKEYDARSEGFSSCRLVDVRGWQLDSPAVRLHDQRTKAESGLPLA